MQSSNSALAETYDELWPTVSRTFKFAFAYQVVMNKLDITTAANALIVTTTLAIVVGMVVKLSRFVGMCITSMENYIATTTRSNPPMPSLIEYLITPTRLLHFVLRDCADLLANCFAVLMGTIILGIQPDDEFVSLVFRILLALMVLSFYWMLGFAFHMDT